MSRASRQKIDKRDDAVALYHVIYHHEGFEEAAQELFTLVREAQAKFPNKRRSLYLDIDGHRNAKGGFDEDMFELQQNFLLDFLGQYLSEIHCPLASITNKDGQDNSIPDKLKIERQNEGGE